MGDAVRDATPWPTFVGLVLIVAVLYWAQSVIVPVALALLMAFLLTPVVTTLQHYIGRVSAVLAVVVLAFTLLGATGWVVTQQLASLVHELPRYEHNIHQKISDIRGAGKGSPVETLQKTAEDIQADIDEHKPSATTTQPLIVRPEQVSGLWTFPAAVAPLLGPLATAGLIVALVVFMLLEREGLRNRLIELFGHGRLIVTTKAFDEAGRRVSRYLLAQSMVNLAFGSCVGIGLFLIGVPYPLLWGALAAALRFIPYVGPAIAAGAPLLVALAALEGWTRPLLVLALFVGLEVCTNLVFETMVYAGAAGVSQVALLVAVAFWSWLWGPLGLLMATPLTVCLVVMGKYMPGFEFISTLMSDEPVLPPDVGYYQRLIAGDQGEAAEILERHASAHAPETVYDAVMLPALNYAERDRIEGRLTADEEQAIVEATRELLTELSLGAPECASKTANGPIPVLGLAVQAEAGLVALRMLEELLKETPLVLEVQPHSVLSSELAEEMKRGHHRAVCIADLPPSAPSRSRYLVKRLRAAAPDVPIIVGRWAPPALADDTTEPLTTAGATHVAATLIDSRDCLVRVLHLPAQERPKPDAA